MKGPKEGGAGGAHHQDFFYFSYRIIIKVPKEGGASGAIIKIFFIFHTGLLLRFLRKVAPEAP